MNHYLQGIPGSQTLPTEKTCRVLPHFETSCMSQIIRCGGLSSKSLTLSEMTGPGVGRAQRCSRGIRVSERWEYGMVNKDAALHPVFSFPCHRPFCLFLFFLSLPWDFWTKKRSTVWGKSKETVKEVELMRNPVLDFLHCYLSFPRSYSLKLFLVNIVKKMQWNIWVRISR